MKWFHQVEHWGLGNFVMATPLLKLHFDKFGPVPVFFSSGELRNLYSKSPFIKVLPSQPRNRPFETSRHPMKRAPKESDSEALCRIHFGVKGKIPDTFVPYSSVPLLDKQPGKKYVAIFHGCLNGKNVKFKNLGEKTRQKMIDAVLQKGFVPVIFGTKKDRKLFWRHIDLSACINCLDKFNLSDTVSVMSQCDFFISNDTGLYHVAGAMKMTGLVMWTLTNPVKNRSTAKTITHVKSLEPSVFINSIDKFLESL